MQDTYLDDRITPGITEQAAQFVETVYPQVTDEYHKNRLIQIESYKIACIDNQSEADDIYGIKYGQYKSMFKDAVHDALDSIKTSSGLSSLSITMERG